MTLQFANLLESVARCNGRYETPMTYTPAEMQELGSQIQSTGVLRTTEGEGKIHFTVYPLLLMLVPILRFPARDRIL